MSKTHRPEEEEEIFVPLKEKKQMQKRKIALLATSLIILGLAMFFTIVMILRSGGPARILFVVIAIALGYLLYEAITRFRRIQK